MRITINSILLFFAITLLNTFGSVAQTYTVQGINDSDIISHPVQDPVHLVSKSFIVEGTSHVEEINSTNLRNISIMVVLYIHIDQTLGIRSTNHM
jgi:hypothetical protein